MNGYDLKISRAILSVTQQQLADLLEMSKSMISNYECGIQPIPKTVQLAVNHLLYLQQNALPNWSPIRIKQLEINSGDEIPFEVRERLEKAGCEEIEGENL